MAGCTYKDCTLKRDGFTHMFRYPVSDKLRCQQWLINAQKLDHFPIQQLKNRVICEHHFRDDNFRNHLLKNRLTFDAVPTLDGPFCGSNNSLKIAKDFQQDYSQTEFSMLNDSEIEIEEHDVLENPDIKRIFPDLSIIKKEISVYEALTPGVAEVKQEIIRETSECNPVQEQIPECKPIIRHNIPEYKPIIQQNIPECKPIIQQNIPECKQIIQQNIPECKPIIQQNIPECKSIIQQNIPECKPIIQQHIAECKPIIQQHIPECQPIIQQHKPESKANRMQQHTISISTPPLETKIKKASHQTPILLSLLSNKKTSTEPPSDNNLETHLRFKTFLDSLVDDSFDTTDDNSCNSHSSTDTQYLNDNTASESCDFIGTSKDYKIVRNNILILGSKPSDHDLKNTSQNIKQIKVILKDIGFYLNTSKQFCKKCSILFPNIEALKRHTNDIHDSAKKVLVANKKLKQSKHQLLSVNIKIQCEICKISFSSKGNLNKHLKRFHCKKSNNNKNNIQERELRSSLQRETKKPNLQVNDKTKSSGNHYCFHCTKVFQSHNSLIEHLYDVINPNLNDSCKPESNKKSTKEDTINKGSHSANKIMSQKITCSICSREFLNEKDLRHHFSEIHIKKKTKTNNKYTSNKNNRVETAVVDKGKLQGVYNEKFNQENTQKLIKNMTRNKREYIINNIDENTDNYESEQEYSDTEYDKTFSDQETSDKKSDTNIQEKELYQCFVCSKYITYFKSFCAHMVDHNININVDVDKKVFNPQCKFCDLKHADIKSFNKHLFTDHADRKNKKIQLDNKAFQSVLFECVKCNIFFLSANAAKNHSDHKEIILNWRCSDCQRTFKVKDKPLHLKQHLLSKKITAYALSKSALNLVLFKCLKCAVHFSEEEYLIHSTTCELEPPNSVYCNTCDILINKNDMDAHERNHKCNKLIASDFTIVVSAFLVNNPKKMAEPYPYTRSKFALTFCYTCNCFISDVSCTRKAHIEGRCGVICQRMCKKCGLIFTNRGYLSHKSLHDDVKNLSVQAFHFYDIKTKTQMRPPMPEYPKCNICKVHFLNKNGIKEHECNQQKFTICNICHIKFTKAAFKLHMNFHNYKLSRPKKIVIKYEHDDEVASEDISRVSKLEESTPLVLKQTLSPILKETQQSVLSTVTEADVKKWSDLYSCVCCHIIFDDYDKVVQHCHVHYGYTGTLTNDQTESEANDVKLLKSLKFDPFYFRFDNSIWFKHIFEKLSLEEIEKRVSHSIYKLECRFLMEEIQSGPSNLVLYKCDLCLLYIDPSNIYSHAGSICKFSKKHPCSHCGLNFHSAGYCMIHEKLHDRKDINKSSFKIILFNKKEHQQFTKIMYNSHDKFIFYQCRNCESIVDKLQRDKHQCYHTRIFKCPYCGLLFYQQEYESHLGKHGTTKYFDIEHIIVIMFGKLDVRKENSLRPSFNGTVYDLTFYKCENCGLCLEKKSEITVHVCVDNLSKSICPKCRLCFLKKKFQTHLRLHEKNLELEYGDFCSNIISFNRSAIDVCDDEPMEVEYTNQNEKNNTEQNKKSSSYLKEIIYKCNCGLHFLEQKNALSHTTNCQPKAKISKQNCFRCDLLFTPMELFNHLLKHHSNKKVKYDYEIKSVT